MKMTVEQAGIDRLNRERDARMRRIETMLMALVNKDLWKQMHRERIEDHKLIQELYEQDVDKAIENIKKRYGMKDQAVAGKGSADVDGHAMLDAAPASPADKFAEGVR